MKTFIKQLVHPWADSKSFTAEFPFICVSIVMLCCRCAWLMLYIISIWDHTWNVSKHYSLDFAAPSTDHRIQRWMWDLPPPSRNFPEKTALLDRHPSRCTAVQRDSKTLTDQPGCEVVPAADELLWAGEGCWWGGDGRSAALAVRRVCALRSRASRWGWSGRNSQAGAAPPPESRSQDVTRGVGTTHRPNRDINVSARGAAGGKGQSSGRLTQATWKPRMGSMRLKWQ